MTFAKARRERLWPSMERSFELQPPHPLKIQFLPNAITWEEKGTEERGKGSEVKKFSGFFINCRDRKKEEKEEAKGN